MPVKLSPPPKRKSATSTEFFEAIAQGNDHAAADTLRRLDHLSSSDLHLLAELMIGDPAQCRIFPFRIKLVRRQRGRPADAMSRRAEDFRIALEEASARGKSGKREAAVETTKQNLKKGRATIFRALKATNRIKPKGQSLSKTPN